MFYYNKSDEIEPMCVQMKKYKEARIPVKHVRCDNPGENKSLEMIADNSE